MDNRRILMNIAGITPGELLYLQHATALLNEDQLRDFVVLYSGRRKRAQDILLYTLLGFVAIAGVQRFVLGQTVMGIIYLLTAGFFWIGTIVDLINHKRLTDEYNQRASRECLKMITGY